MSSSGEAGSGLSSTRLSRVSGVLQGGALLGVVILGVETAFGEAKDVPDDVAATALGDAAGGLIIARPAHHVKQQSHHESHMQHVYTVKFI